jgi:hypothetical protein
MQDAGSGPDRGRKGGLPSLIARLFRRRAAPPHQRAETQPPQPTPEPEPESVWCARLQGLADGILTQARDASPIRPEEAQTAEEAASAAAIAWAARMAPDGALPAGMVSDTFLESAGRLCGSFHGVMRDLTYPPALLEAHRWYDPFYEIRVFDPEVTRHLAAPLSQADAALRALVPAYLNSSRRPLVPRPHPDDAPVHRAAIEHLTAQLNSRFGQDMAYAPAGRPHHGALSRLGGAGAARIADEAARLAEDNAWAFGALVYALMDRGRSDFLRRYNDDDNMGAGSFAFGRDAALDTLVALSAPTPDG